jgi:hypothetical protein
MAECDPGYCQLEGLKEDKAALEQSNAVLVAALRKYGQHHPSCNAHPDSKSAADNCSCGYSKALPGHTAGMVCVPRDKLSLCAEFLECDSGFSGRQLADELRAMLKGG